MADTPAQPVNLQKTLLAVHVGSPDHVFFDGQALSISTANEKGEFDILPAHENFISIISKKLIIIDPSNKRNELKIDTAVLHVNENKVNVFVGIPTIDMESLTPISIKNRLSTLLTVAK